MIPPQQTVIPAVRTRSIFICASADDLAVKFGRSIEVVIVGRQASLGQRVGLRLRQHAQRAASLHAQSANAANHFKHAFERLAFGNIAPRRAHAEARRSLSVSGAGRSQRFVHVEQVSLFETRFIVRRLRTVRAILRTAACLDAQQDAALHLIRRVMLPMHGLRPEYEIGQRRHVDRLDFLDCPIVAQFYARRRGMIWEGSEFQVYSLPPERRRTKLASREAYCRPFSCPQIFSIIKECGVGFCFYW